MKRKTIKELEERIKYLEERNSDLNRASNGYLERIENILEQYEVTEWMRKRVSGWEEIIDVISSVSARAKTEGQYISLIERQVSAENARLWHIVRTVVGDHTLPKPITKNLNDMAESGFNGQANFSNE